MCARQLEQGKASRRARKIVAPPTVYEVIRPATAEIPGPPGVRGRTLSPAPTRVVRRATRRAPPRPVVVRPDALRGRLPRPRTGGGASGTGPCDQQRALSVHPHRLEGDLGDPRRSRRAGTATSPGTSVRKHGRGSVAESGIAARRKKSALTASRRTSARRRARCPERRCPSDPDDDSQHQNPGREARPHRTTLQVTHGQSPLHAEEPLRERRGVRRAAEPGLGQQEHEAHERDGHGGGDECLLSATPDTTLRASSPVSASSATPARTSARRDTSRSSSLAPRQEVRQHRTRAAARAGIHVASSATAGPTTAARTKGSPRAGPRDGKTEEPLERAHHDRRGAEPHQDPKRRTGGREQGGFAQEQAEDVASLHSQRAQEGQRPPSLACAHEERVEHDEGAGDQRHHADGREPLLDAAHRIARERTSLRGGGRRQARRKSRADARFHLRASVRRRGSVGRRRPCVEAEQILRRLHPEHGDGPAVEHRDAPAPRRPTTGSTGGLPRQRDPPRRRRPGRPSGRTLPPARPRRRS